jgi:hypothetical protein
MVRGYRALLANMNERRTSNGTEARRRAVSIGRERIHWLSPMLLRVNVGVVGIRVVLERGEHARRRGRWHGRYTGRRRMGVHGSLAWVHGSRRLSALSIRRLLAFFSIRAAWFAPFFCILASEPSRRAMLAAWPNAVALHRKCKYYVM